MNKENLTGKDSGSSSSCSDTCVFKQMRNSLQQGIYAVINPFVRLLIRLGVTPNIVTAIGLLGSFVSAAMVFRCGYEAHIGESINYSWLLWAGIVNIVFSLFDMLDGQVARLGGMVSRYGAFYDSVLDRYSELFTLGSITFYFVYLALPSGVFVTLLAVMGSIMVSYIRARGESLGAVAKVGLMQRPERVVVTAVALIAAGWTGIVNPESEAPEIILIVAMGIIALLANITALARVSFCKKNISED